MEHIYSYELAVTWSGNQGSGTSSLRGFSRNHTISAEGKPSLTGSADTPFRGDVDKWNPELLLLAALSSCHMMSYFFVAVQRGIVVTEYNDAPTATLTVERDGRGAITTATLRPRMTVQDPSMMDAAVDAHAEAARLCFIKNSVNFDVRYEPEARVEDPSA